MDTRLLAIAAKAAGTYFIVTDNSLVPTTEVPTNLRLFFVNTASGPVNTAVVFQKGDTAGLHSIFGKTSRQQEKRGNFSISSCETALLAGPIAVMNLRLFTDDDKLGIGAMSPNKTVAETKLATYTSVFNTNGFWTARAKNIQDLLTRENLLNFANVGSSDVSFFVVASNDFAQLTGESDETITSTQLDIDDYPSIDPNMKLSDSFVDVYIFNNTFPKETVSTNRFYGQLFDANGEITRENIDVLSLVKEAGFNRKVTGSLIPNLKNEFDTDISIDTLLNTLYPQTGIIAHINDDLLEAEIDENGVSVLNLLATNYYSPDGTLTSTKTVDPLLSYAFRDIEDVKEIDLDSVRDADVVNHNTELLFWCCWRYFPANTWCYLQKQSLRHTGKRLETRR